MPHPPLVTAPWSCRGVVALSATCGFAVANLYYSQPLLPQMTATFGADTAAQGAIAMLPQAGYAIDLLLFGSLGDRLDRRWLITVLLLVNMIGLALCATATSLSGLRGGWPVGNQRADHHPGRFRPGRSRTSRADCGTTDECSIIVWHVAGANSQRLCRRTHELARDV